MHGKLERAFAEIDNLTKQKDNLTVALGEAKIMLKRKTDLGSQAASTIKVDFQIDFRNTRQFSSPKGQNIS